MNRFAKFRRRSSRARLLFLEAALALAWAKAQIHLLPFRRLAPQLGRPQTETPREIPAADRETAVDISWAVQTAARYIPLRLVCLPQAIAAQRLLLRRGIASTLYLGVATDPKKRDAITAHAWLRAGDKILTGEHEAATHRMLTSFANHGNLRPTTPPLASGSSR